MTAAFANRSRRLRLAMSAVLAGLVCGPSVSAAAQDVPDSRFLVINRTQKTLNCRYRIDRAQWSKPFALKSGDQFGATPDSEDSVLMLVCAPPVQQFRYTLRPGERYVLRSIGQSVDLQLVDTD